MFKLSSCTMNALFSNVQSQTVRRLVFLAYLVCVLGATLAPLSGEAYEAVSGLDKLVHVLLFGGVAALLCWNLLPLNTRAATSVFAITVAFAGLIELVQSVLWYRSGDLWDLVAGAVGALIGVSLFPLVARKWGKTRDQPN
jgi:VanZ family protein